MEELLKRADLEDWITLSLSLTGQIINEERMLRCLEVTAIPEKGEANVAVLSLHRLDNQPAPTDVVMVVRSGLASDQNCTVTGANGRSKTIRRYGDAPKYEARAHQDLRELTQKFLDQAGIKIDWVA